MGVNSLPKTAQDSKDGGKAQLDLELEGLEPDERSIKSSELAVTQTSPSEHYGINEDLSYTGKGTHSSIMLIMDALGHR